MINAANQQCTNYQRYYPKTWDTITEFVEERKFSISKLNNEERARLDQKFIYDTKDDSDIFTSSQLIETLALLRTSPTQSFAEIVASDIKRSIDKNHGELLDQMFEEAKFELENKPYEPCEISAYKEFRDRQQSFYIGR